MNKKDKKQKQVGVINHISQPLNFRHNFHLGLDGVRGDHNDVHMQELQAAFESVTSSNNVTPSPRHPFENLNAEYSRNDPVMDGRNEAAMYQQGVELRAPRPCRSRDISEENSVNVKLLTLMILRKYTYTKNDTYMCIVIHKLGDKMVYQQLISLTNVSVKSCPFTKLKGCITCFLIDGYLTNISYFKVFSPENPQFFK